MEHKIICHRGINRNDENTYNSITDVIALPDIENVTYGVEFDVQITKDNQIICYHDDTLLRLHDYNQRVCDITIDCIEKYNLPYFSDIMHKLSVKKNLIIDVEIKVYYPIDPDKIKLLCKNVVNICESCNITMQCMFTAFDDIVIHELIIINEQIPINIGKIIWKDYNLQTFEYLKKLGVNTLILHKDMIIDALDEYNELLNDIDLYVYTLFCINEENNNDYDKDDQFIINIKEKNIGLITDDYKRILKLI